MFSRRFSSLFTLAFLFVQALVFAQKPVIERIDPPHWWVGFQENDVELLVKGDHFSEDVMLDGEGITIASVKPLPNPHYLKVVLKVETNARAQELTLTFKNGKAKRKIKYQFKARDNSNKTLMGLSPADMMYLITPDRFANGNPRNDVVEGMNESTIDRSGAYKRHGGDIEGIRQKLDYLHDLGMTALWINPLLENNQPEWSYHGYAITDHYNIDPRFGTNQEYRQLVDEMHAKGMKMIMDVVYNHSGNEHYLYKDLPDSNMINFHSEFTQTNYRATALHDPHASKAERDLMENGWFDKHMPDLNQRDETMANYLIQNSIWWIEEYGIDAYRIDTYAYPDQGFMAELSKRILAEYPDFFIFGETWVHGVQVQNFFVENNPFRKPFNSNLQSVTDFQWYFALEKGIHEKTDWSTGISRIYYALAADYQYEQPENLVTFVDNHDIARWFGHCGEDFEKFKIGIGMLMTTRGIPQLYYGTEILMKATDGHGEIREDFWGGWPEDTINKFEVAGRTELENQAFDYIKTLANYRKGSKALTEGELTQFAPKDGLYAFVRNAEGANTVLVLVNNNAEERKTIDMLRMSELIEPGAWVKNVITGEKFKTTEQLPVGYGIWILEVLD